MQLDKILASQPYLFATFLLSIRLSAVFLATPILSVAQMPGVVRILLILVVSLALSMGISPEQAGAIASDDFPSLLFASASELALGVLLSLGILIAFGAISIAGRLLDIQIGFGIGQVFDPISRQSLPILTTVFNQLAIVLFFTLNGHHALLRGLALSLQYFPLGRAWPINASYSVILRQVGALFSLGFSLAAPIVFCILLLELALGVVARNLPQMNMFTMGIPVKIAIGLATLAIWHTGFGGIMSRIYGSIYLGWEDLFQLQAMREGV
jgi:flagellar biosynthetic protein FliR